MAYEPRRIFVEDVTGKRHMFRLRRGVRIEATRQSRTIQRRVGPSFGGAIAEMSPEGIEEEAWAFLSDSIVFLDGVSATKRFSHAFAFANFEARLRSRGFDLSLPLTIVAFLVFPSKEGASAAVDACRHRAPTNLLATGFGPSKDGEEWFVRLIGDMALNEPASASLVQSLEGIAAELGGKYISFGVATDVEGTSFIPFRVPPERPTDSEQGSASSDTQ